MKNIILIIFLILEIFCYSQPTGINNEWSFPSVINCVGINSTGNVSMNRVSTAINRTVQSGDYIVEVTTSTVGATTTITLPNPTLAANLNRIVIVKNATSEPTVMVTVDVTGGGALIDDETNVHLYRYKNCTFISDGTQWRIIGSRFNIRNVEVHPRNGFRTIAEAVKFFRYHMIEPSSITVSSSSYNVTDSVHIDLPYYLTINGTGYSSVTLNAATGLIGKPFFVLKSGVKFKSMSFNGASLTNYGNSAGENCFSITKSGQYYELEDISINNFNKGIYDTTNSEIWLNNSTIQNCKASGVEINTASVSKVFRTVTTDYFYNIKSLLLTKSGANSITTVELCHFKNTNVTDTSFCYRGGVYLYKSIAFKNNWWDLNGKLIGGFDFSLSSGRDANIVMLNNVGLEDKNPHGKINLVGGVATTTITTGNTFYKASWTNTSSYTCKWTIGNNRFTYQPINVKDVTGYVNVSLACNQANRTVSICVCKNGDNTVQYGTMQLRLATANQPLIASLNVYLPDFAQGNYYEVFVSSTNNGDVITVDNVAWWTEAR